MTHYRKKARNMNERRRFVDGKDLFDRQYAAERVLSNPIFPFHGVARKTVELVSPETGERLEEYFRLQFAYALVNSGMYPREVIGLECYFPKGSSSAKALRLDIAIFDDPTWLEHYRRYWDTRESSELEWLGHHLLFVGETKREGRTKEKILLEQLRPAMREKEPGDATVIGAIYAEERLFLFQRRNGRFLRYDTSKNVKGDDSNIVQLSLQLPDPYIYIPTFEELKLHVSKPSSIDYTTLSVDSLELIQSIGSIQHQDELSNVLRTLTRLGLFNQRGYRIFIETLALKIFDEKRNGEGLTQHLLFYVTPDEKKFDRISEPAAQAFVLRMKSIFDDAMRDYEAILRDTAIDWENTAHIHAAVEICSAFQLYSFVRSAKSDLYQLVFYNFANEFKRAESAQFLTPLPVIEFLVDLLNPRVGETVCDPCCGIADFLSMSFVHSHRTHIGPRQDHRLFGVDLDADMVMLASLNMLLNGDGAARLFHNTPYGSLLYKVTRGNPPSLAPLDPAYHQRGQWDKWPDGTRLEKFDLVLTNPPFGEDRAFRPANEQDAALLSCYETWSLKGKSDAIDQGVLFLENAVRILRPGGRFGIVLSNSIASINKWQEVRRWLMRQIRLVGLFDLPPNVFAETGVNTSILVGYKPATDAELKQLQVMDYEIFTREIINVGYERRTSKRNVYFKPLYRYDPERFEALTDNYGRAILLEDFSSTIEEFQLWLRRQELALQRAFIGQPR